MRADPNVAVDPARVMTKAFLRTMTLLGLTGREAGAVVGVSEATISRMKSGAALFEAGSKPFELAVLLVRAFRSLDAILGGDETALRRWLRGPNSALGGAPIDRMTTTQGLVDVVTYLDTRRATL